MFLRPCSPKTIGNSNIKLSDHELGIKCTMKLNHFDAQNRTVGTIVEKWNNLQVFSKSVALLFIKLCHVRRCICQVVLYLFKRLLCNVSQGYSSKLSLDFLLFSRTSKRPNILDIFLKSSLWPCVKHLCCDKRLIDIQSEQKIQWALSHRHSLWVELFTIRKGFQLLEALQN